MEYSLDIISVAVCAVLALIGYKKGILITVLTIASTVISAVIAYLFSDDVLGALSLENASWARLIIPLILFVVCCILCGLFSRLISKAVGKIPVVGKVNRVLGAILGFIEASFILLIVFSLIWFIIKYVPHKSNDFLSAISNSYIYNFVVDKLFIHIFNFGN